LKGLKTIHEGKADNDDDHEGNTVDAYSIIIASAIAVDALLLCRHNVVLDTESFFFEYGQCFFNNPQGWEKCKSIRKNHRTTTTTTTTSTHCSEDEFFISFVHDDQDYISSNHNVRYFLFERLPIPHHDSQVYNNTNR
jgi:hypothetical protein